MKMTDLIVTLKKKISSHKPLKTHGVLMIMLKICTINNVNNKVLIARNLLWMRWKNIEKQYSHTLVLIVSPEL